MAPSFLGLAACGVGSLVAGYQGATGLVNIFLIGILFFLALTAITIEGLTDLDIRITRDDFKLGGRAVKLLGKWSKMTGKHPMLYEEIKRKEIPTP